MQPTLQGLKQFPGRVSQQLANASGFRLTAMTGAVSRIVIAVIGLKGAVSRLPRRIVVIADASFQFAFEVGPNITMVGMAESGNAGAVNGETGECSRGLVFPGWGLQIHPHHGHHRIDGPQGSGFAGVFVLYVAIARIGAHGAVAGGAIHLRCTDRQLRRPAIAIRLDHRLGKLFG